MTAAELELAKRTKRDRERQQRYRAKRRANSGAPLRTAQAGPSPAPASMAPPPAGPGPLPSAPATFPVHETVPMANLAQPADRWTAVPPGGVDGLVVEPEVLPAPPTAGAHKVAGIAAALFALSLEDAATRFPALAATAAQFGVTDLEAAKGKAVAWAHATVLRTCAKHGFGIAIPYEDEIASVAIVGGSIAYQWARATGKLDKKSAPVIGRAEAPPPPTASHDDEPTADSDFEVLRVPDDDGKPAAHGELAMWKAA